MFDHSVYWPRITIASRRLVESILSMADSWENTFVATHGEIPEAAATGGDQTDGEGRREGPLC